MPIIKPGFTPGFRGRHKAASMVRRVHYLASEDQREDARLMGMEGQRLTIEQAIAGMGGPEVEYHEVILAPSEVECRAIDGRIPGDQARARGEAGHRIAQAYAEGRPYFFAIHEDHGRFHFHMAVRGPMSSLALGKHGQVQRAWNREAFGDEPRITDWEAHKRFRASKSSLQQVTRDQRENEVHRREAVRQAAPGEKSQAARPFEVRGRELIEERFTLEKATLLARYEARGQAASPRHQAEVGQASHRRTGALRRLEQRELDREVGDAKFRADRAVEWVGRTAEGGTRFAASAGRRAFRDAVIVMGLPDPTRLVADRVAAAGEEAARAATRVGTELAKGAARSSVDVAQAAVKLGAGLVAAIPTGGASLMAATQSAGKDLGGAGKELGKGVGRAGKEAVKGAGRTVRAGIQGPAQGEADAERQAAGTVARTALVATKNVVTVSPVRLGQTVAGGATDLAKTAVGEVMPARAPLPKPAQAFFAAARRVPIVGIGARAIQLSAEMSIAALPAELRGQERDR